MCVRVRVRARVCQGGIKILQAAKRAASVAFRYCHVGYWNLAPGLISWYVCVYIYTSTHHSVHTHMYCPHLFLVRQSDFAGSLNPIHPDTLQLCISLHICLCGYADEAHLHNTIMNTRANKGQSDKGHGSSARWHPLYRRGLQLVTAWCSHTICMTSSRRAWFRFDPDKLCFGHCH